MGNTNPNQQSQGNYELSFTQASAAAAELMRLYGGGSRGLYDLFNLPLEIEGATRVVNFVNGMSTGTNDIYTVPAGKRFFLACVLYLNHTGGAVTPNFLVQGKGQVVFSSSVSNNNTRALAPNVVLEPNQVLQVNGTAGLTSVVIIGFLFDSSIPFYSNWVTNIDTTNRTLYQVPANKIAMPVMSNTPTFGFASSFPMVMNNSGASATMTGYYLRSGQSVGVDTLIASATVNNANAFTVFSIPPLMLAGDSLVITSSSVGPNQTGFVTVFERDA